MWSDDVPYYPVLRKCRRKLWGHIGRSRLNSVIVGMNSTIRDLSCVVLVEIESMFPPEPKPTLWDNIVGFIVLMFLMIVTLSVGARIATWIKSKSRKGIGPEIPKAYRMQRISDADVPKISIRRLHCPNCGKIMPGSARFCGFCGSHIEST